MTPFVLAALHRESGGRTLRANRELIEGNARLAGRDRRRAPDDADQPAYALEPAAVLLHELAVGVDPAAVPQVLDHVPVDAADVRAAGRGVGVADREVDRAVDLLVEADVLREALDPRVAADPELAEPPRALVGVERPEQELLAVGGARLDDPAALEHEPHPGDLVAEVDRRELAEGDLALGRVLDRRVEDLAAGHVDVPVLDRAACGPASESVRSVRSPTIRTSLAASNRAAIAPIRLASASQSSSTAP